MIQDFLGGTAVRIRLPARDTSLIPGPGRPPPTAEQPKPVHLEPVLSNRSRAAVRACAPPQRTARPLPQPEKAGSNKDPEQP